MAITSINQALLKAKFFYFFFASAMDTLLPYLYLYYKHVLYFSPKQITLLIAARPLCLIFAAPTWGTIADKSKKYRLILLMCLLAYITTYGLIYSVEPVAGFSCLDILRARKAASNASSSSNETGPSGYLYTAKNQDNFYPGTIIENSFYSWPFSKHEYDTTEEITKDLFTTMLLVAIIGEFFSSPAYTFADVYTLQTLDGDLTKYGYQVLPGVMGTGIVSAALILYTHPKLMAAHKPCDKSMILSDKPYFITFLIFIGLSFFVAIFFKYVVNQSYKEEAAYSKCQCKILDALRLVFKSRVHTCFLAIVLLCGIGSGAKVSVTTAFLSDLDRKHHHKHIMPTITACHFISHAVFVGLSPYLLKKFGHMKIIAAGVLVYGLSFVFYSIISDPFWMLISEPFDGLARNLTRIAIITYVGSPPRVGAALQGITHALYLGVGTSIGTFICGMVIYKYGYILVFAILGVCFLIGFGFCLAVGHYLPSDITIHESFKLNYSKLLNDDAESDFDFLLEKIESDKTVYEPVIEHDNTKKD